MRDELFAPRILSLRRGREEVYEILRLGCGLGPRLGRSRQKKSLEIFVATAQGFLYRLKLMEPLTADFGRFLRGQAAVLVELDRVVSHGPKLSTVCGVIPDGYAA